MADSQTITVSVEQFIAAWRDGAIIIGICFFGWKARSWAQPVIEFFTRANSFMVTTQHGMGELQTGMKTLLDNHLTHIESDLKTLAHGRKIDPQESSVDSQES